jgi:putative transposase
MRRSSFSDAEITTVVRALEAGRPAHELCDTWQVSMRTLYRWKRKFGGLKPFAVEALRRLEQENRRLQAEAGQAVSPSGHGPALLQPARAPAIVRSDLGWGERDAPVAVGRYAALRLR